MLLEKINNNKMELSFSEQENLSSQVLTQDNMRPKVLITGVTGFLGNHVCKLFLEDGTYKVRGSTTNPNNKAKREGIRQACGDYLFEKELELVKADLIDA